MYKIELTRNSEKTLNILKEKDNINFQLIVSSISELKNNIKLNVKNIGDDIFRKRVGRWRILFTVENKIIILWLIEIEKDTKKDYNNWKKYILSKVKK